MPGSSSLPSQSDPAGPDPSWLARVAPSWAFEGHRVPNGHALVAVVLGFVSAVFLSAPGGGLLVLGAVLAVPALLAARTGRRRANEQPWLGGRRLATSGAVLVGAGIALALTWPVVLS